MQKNSVLFSNEQLEVELFNKGEYYEKRFARR